LTELRRPQPLDFTQHDRSAFDSGAPALDEWLRHDASQNRRRNTAATWVITHADCVVVAYVSVSMTSIDRGSAPEAIARRAPDPVPALLIGRLAVDRTVAGLGVGAALAAHVLATAVELNAQAACRAVVVSALDDRARSWWERLGFRAFAPDDPAGLDLYLLTAEIEATLRHLGLRQSRSIVGRNGAPASARRRLPGWSALLGGSGRKPHERQVSDGTMKPSPAAEIRRRDSMQTKRFIYYEESELIVGWLEEYPDYRTQGETLDELKKNLQELYNELTSGQIPCVHKVGELSVA